MEFDEDDDVDSMGFPIKKKDDDDDNGDNQIDDKKSKK